MAAVVVGTQRIEKNQFFKQLELALAFTSYGLFLVAFDTRHLTMQAVQAVVLGAMAYGLFSSSVLRFSVACVAQVFVAAACLESTSPNTVHVLVLAQTVGIGAIFVWQPRRVLWPLGYSLVIGLFVTLLLPMIEASRVVAWPSSIVQVIAEVALLMWLLRSGKSQSRKLIALATVAAIALGALSVPGVLAALGIVVIGHLERDAVVRAMGIGFLPIYLIAFYYDLDTSLLFKSGTLIASGAVLWTSRFFVRREVAGLKESLS